MSMDKSKTRRASEFDGKQRGRQGASTTKAALKNISAKFNVTRKRFLHWLNCGRGQI